MFSKLMPFLFLAGSLALAQGPRGPQAGSASRPGLGVDVTKIQTVEGEVSAVNIAYGAQYPSIQINQLTIKMAPIWFLLEGNMEIKVGDKLRVTAAPSLRSTDPYLVAITVANLTTGADLTLRDADGRPLWMTGPGKQGERRGSAACSLCVPVSINTVTGIVDQVTAGLGIQMPTLVLKTSDGQVLTVKIGPERILEAADFEIRAGDTLTVRYAVMTSGALLALELTNAAGTTVVLRDDDGTPAW